MVKLFEEWKETPEGKMFIARALNEAEAKANYYRELQKKSDEQALEKYYKESSERAKEEGLVKRLGPNGALDDDYYAELPLDIGYHMTVEGPVLEYVSLGGHEVTQYLPPNVLKDIQMRIETYGEDHGF